ncbi:MAG: ankyrin repeat domain-containing protein, partial [Alphaproteobacteria bacterium]
MNLFHTKKKFLKAVAAGDAKTVAAYLAVSTSWARTQDEKTKDYALHSAIRGGHTDIVRQLLKAGATLWYGGNESQTPLHAAVMSGNLAIVKILLETPDNNFDAKDVNGLSPLHYAIRDNKTEILKAFLETRKADLNASDRPALYYAVECGQTDCVKLLLAAGADPSVRRTVTSYEYDDDDDYYYSHRREPRKTTVTYFSPLNCACTNNHTEIAGELLKAGARWMSMEFPLHAAAAHGNVPLMTLLIQNGFNPKQLDQTQETLLHKVAKSRNRESLSEAVLFVLAQGVDKNALDKDNRTALSYVQQFALTDIVKILQDPLPAQLLAP